GADGDADVGLGQCRCVVDAVTDHGHDPALALELGDLLTLVLGPDLGEDLVDAELAGHGAGDRFGVAGDHHHVRAELVEGVDGLAGFGPDLVVQGQCAGDVAVDENVQHRGAARGPFSCGRQRVPVGLGQQGRAAHGDGAAVDCGA